MKIALLDNGGSFTFTLRAMLIKCGADVQILDANASRADLLAAQPKGIVITPGVGSAGHAGDVGLVSQLIRSPTDIPMLGLGLGMLGMLHFTGCNLRPLQDFLHGSNVDVSLSKHGLFMDVPRRISAGCYLTRDVDPLGLSDGWDVIAEGMDGRVLGVAHQEHPWFGLQFQPASVLTAEGTKILENFLGLCIERKA